MEYPSDRFDHQGVFSLVKELNEERQTLPVPSACYQGLRAASQPFTALSESKNSYELELNLAADTEHEIVLFADAEGKGLALTFDLAKGLVTVDRSQAGEQYAQEFGTSRSCPIANQATTANIFIDNSIFEIFINKGEKYFLVGSSHMLIKMES